MCSSHQHHDAHTTTQANDPGALTFRVDDMTCEHCSGTIRKAIETTLPGTRVSADPATRLVSVSGADSLARLQEIVTLAGYTPTSALTHA